MRSKILLPVLLVLLTGYVFSAGQNDPAAAESGQVLRIIHPVLQESWSPLLGGKQGVRWQSLMWASPFYFDKYGILQPYVLTSAVPDSSFTAWTLKIDPAAVFSDGSPITAGDLAGTWNLCVRPGTRNSRAGQFLGGIAGYDDVVQGKAGNMSGLAVADDKTLIVTLSHPDPVFDKRIATALISPVKIAQAEDEQGNEIPGWWRPENGVAVSGPFMPLTMDLEKGTIVLVPNPRFFGPAPKLSGILIQTVTDPAAAVEMLKTGKMDAHTELVAPDAAVVLGTDFFNGPPLSQGHHFWFDASKPPLDDIHLRKALIMSIDPAELVKAAFPGASILPAGQILNKVPGVDKNYPPYPYDPVAAVKELALSRYSKPSEMPPLVIRGITYPSHVAAGGYLANQWEKILGITGTAFFPSDPPGAVKEEDAQIVRDDVGTRIPDAVSYLKASIHSGSVNAVRRMGGFKNIQIDELLEQAEVLSVNDPERIALGRKAQRIFRDQWMFIPYYYDVMSRWAMPWVVNLDKNDDWQVIEPWNVAIDESKRPK